MDEFEKQVDLHESEWHHDKKQEPFFGPGALYFFSYVAAGLIVYPIARFIVIDVLGW